uniref:Uncharacterized protein n=1 Tax=viral metagenome TaxID=1070528 RepID=A0A6C0LVJ0_9ZZZZ
MISIATDLENIFAKYRKVIKENFRESFAIEAIVGNVNSDRNNFTINYQGNNNFINCWTSLKISELKSGEKIKLYGNLMTYPDENHVYIKIDYYTTINNDFDNKIEDYHKYKQKLHEEKLSQFILNKFHNKFPPKIINRIGIITFEESIILENFKKICEQKYVGDLFIYKLDKTKVDKDFVIALEYFKKYHDINVICILTDKLTMEQILNLSSAECLKYLLMRDEKFPYLISLNAGCISIDYLAKNLFNKKFDQIDNCLTFITNIQETYKQMLTNTMRNCYEYIGQRIENHRANILKLDNFISEFYEINKSIENNISSIINLFESKFKKIYFDLETNELHLARKIINNLSKQLLIQNNIKKIENKNDIIVSVEIPKINNSNDGDKSII